MVHESLVDGIPELNEPNIYLLLVHKFVFTHLYLAFSFSWIASINEVQLQDNTHKITQQ